MADRKTLTFALMDAPFESARSATALRLIDIAARRGYDVNVFAHEGAVLLPFAKQEQRPDGVHQRMAEEETLVLPRVLIASLFEAAAKNGGRLEWINCGMCADERGAGEAIDGVRRGTPADFWKLAASSSSTLVIGTRS